MKKDFKVFFIVLMWVIAVFVSGLLIDTFLSWISSPSTEAVLAGVVGLLLNGFLIFLLYKKTTKK